MSNIIGPDLSQTFTTLLAEGKGFGLLDLFTDQVGQDWRFVKASVAITQFDTVAIKATGSAAPMTEAHSKSNRQIGFAQIAFTIDTFGWVMTRGQPTIRVAASCAVDVALYTTATAGVLDDATISILVQGVVIGSAGSAGGVSAVGAVATYPTIRRVVTL